MVFRTKVLSSDPEFCPSRGILAEDVTLQNLRGVPIPTMPPTLPDFDQIRKSNKKLDKKLTVGSHHVFTQKIHQEFEDVFTMIKDVTDLRQCDTCDELTSTLQANPTAARHSRDEARHVTNLRKTTMRSITDHLQEQGNEAHYCYGEPDLWKLCPILDPSKTLPVCSVHPRQPSIFHLYHMFLFIMYCHNIECEM